jgi:hypothetical protein
MKDKRKRPSPEATAPDEAAPTEDELDEAIEESMDASDPPSYVSKGMPTKPSRQRKRPPQEGGDVEGSKG